MTATIEGQLASLIAQAREEGRAEGRAEATASTAPALVSVERACEQLGCSRSYLYGLIKSGGITAVHLGRRRMIRADSLADLIERGGA